MMWVITNVGEISDDLSFASPVEELEARAGTAVMWVITDVGD
jgi:hypothetical protein